MWSVGVILYMMLSGGEKPVKLNPDDEKIDRDSLQVSINEKIGKLEIESDDLRDLMSRLLVVDPLKRYTSYYSLKHPFITQGDNPPPLLMFEQEAKVIQEKEIKKVKLPLFIFLDVETDAGFAPTQGTQIPEEKRIQCRRRP